MTRRFVATFAAVLALTLIAVAGFNYVVDPLQFYRISRLYPPKFFPAMERYQNAGLARNYAEDVIVIGTSVIQNFLPSHIQKSWGRKATKLSMAGSTAHEQFLVAEAALATGRVKTVLWGLDEPAFAWPAHAVRDDQAPFPFHMYRKTGLNIEYLLSLSTLRLSILAPRGSGETDLDKYEVWYDRYEFGEKAVLKSWPGSCSAFRSKYVPSADAKPDAKSGPSLDRLRGSLDQNLVSLVRAYPNVTFELFLPPLATLRYVPIAAPYLDTLLPFRATVAKELLQYPNVRLRDFQTVPGIVDDLANFKDLNHFSLAISDYIIDAVRDDRDRLGPENITSANTALIKLANRYDLCRDGRSGLGN
jgi:hypothetical protein